MQRAIEGLFEILKGESSSSSICELALEAMTAIIASINDSEDAKAVAYREEEFRGYLCSELTRVIVSKNDPVFEVIHHLAFSILQSIVFVEGEL